MMGKNHMVTGIVSTFTTYTIIQALDKHAFDNNITVVNKVSKSINHLFFNITDNVYLSLAIGLLLLTLGGLLVDLDNKNSILGKFFYIPVGHRTILHSIYPLLGLIMISYFKAFVSWIALGYFWHLFWDSFSYQGLCWFLPFSGYIKYPNGAKIKKGHKLKLYRVGDVSEKWLVFAIVLFGCLSFYLGYTNNLYSLWIL